ncbi:MAG: AAA family ATPase, partial [Actinomycetota bacterium]|nr:AAA family ATPase [Actinomycetota bacterium]
MNLDLPTGTVTFVFTDIEGSTKLLQSLGNRYDAVLSAHNRILREAFTRFGGREVGTEGDSFFVVFPNARGAVEAALLAQMNLDAHDFSDGVKVLVRMGIHTGEGRVVEDNYRGIDVHRAARIAAAAHGGQVLVSAATRALVARSLPESVQLTDLGTHRLKDLEHPEHLYQLEAEGLPSAFPPPRSLESTPHNLPTPLTSFVGRERELREIAKRLRDNRLVTLTGPGGTGKTRLAVQVGHAVMPEYEDGVFMALLSSVADPALVPSAIAQALTLREQGPNPLEETVKQHVSSKNMLLILDNFEHLLDAAFFVAELLNAAPGLKILVTSRAALHLSAEQEFSVPPLSLPDAESISSIDELQGSEAVRLFLQRARAVRPDFALTPQNARDVAEICLRLDGLPLALELAAARIRMLEPHEIARRLDRSLSLLTGGARDLPARHQTLRNTIAWSYDLLDEPLREVFCKLGVFAGGFSLEAVEEVCCEDALDRLETLVAQSLVKPALDPFGGRYLMLEPIRAYALERLEESGAASATRERHAEFFRSLAGRAASEMHGKAQVEWLSRLEVEHGNLRAAMSWTLDSGNNEAAAQLGWDLWMFWWLHGHQEEGRRWMETLLGRELDEHARALALAVAGSMALVQGDHPSCQRYLREGIELARQTGDHVRLALALHNLGLSALNDSDFETAFASFEEALPLFLKAGNEQMISGLRTHLGTAAFMRGDLDHAERETQEALSIARRLGDRISTYFALHNLAQVAFARGDTEAAAPLITEGLTLADEVGSRPRLSYYLEGFALVLAARGDTLRAARLLGASHALQEDASVPTYRYLKPPEPLYSRIVGELRSRMGEQAFDAALSEGRDLSAKQAVAYAHGEDFNALTGAGLFTSPAAKQPPDNGAPEAETRPLVGRKHELELMEGALRQADEGRGGAVFIQGEPGIGKTRLAQEVVTLARARGFWCAVAGGAEAGGTPAYWPWSRIVASLLQVARPGLVEGLGPGVALLAQAVPEIKELTGPIEPPPPVDPDTGRMLLFETATSFLLALAREKPLLLVMEDLQWADAASLQLLGYLAPRLPAAPVLVLGTYRPGDVAPHHPLNEALGALARHQVAQHLELSGLSPEEVRVLLANMIGRDLAEREVVEAVVKRTEGNPFFVTELAKLLALDPGMDAKSVSRAVPSGVQDVLRRRLASLPENSAALLSLAAVAGRDFELRVLEVAGDIGPEETLAQLEAALSAGLVKEHSDSPGVFRFSHDLIRETILGGLTPSRKALLHAKVGKAIQELSGDAGHPIELAHHFFEAVPVTGPEPAIPLALRAAEAAHACLAYEQAEDQLRKALGLIYRLPESADRDVTELKALLGLSSLLTMTLGFGAPETGEALSRAQELCRRLGQTKEMAAVLYGLTIFHVVSARYEDARRLAEELMAFTAHSDDPAEKMISHLAFGIVALHQGEVKLARNHLEQSLAGQSGPRDPWFGAWFPLNPRAFTSTFLAWALWMLGERERARALTREAVEMARSAGDPFTTCHCIAFDIFMAIGQGDVEYVAPRAEELKRLATEHRFPLYVADSVIFDGWTMAHKGQPEAAAAKIIEGTRALAATGAKMLQTLFQAFLA